jgi:hypothetical protein
VRGINELYPATNIFWVIKSKLGWAGRVAHKGGKKSRVYNFGGKNLRERDHVENLGLHGMMILNRSLKNKIAELD